MGERDVGKRRPSNAQLEAALGVLLWLHEHTEDDRDQISHVRILLDEEVDRRG